jgi:hypothetical protein
LTLLIEIAVTTGGKVGECADWWIAQPHAQIVALRPIDLAILRLALTVDVAGLASFDTRIRLRASAADQTWETFGSTLALRVKAADCPCGD